MTVVLLVVMAASGSVAAYAAESEPTYTFVEGEGDAEFAFGVAIQAAGRWASEAQVRVAFNYQDAGNFNYVKQSSAGVTVVAVEKGQHRRVASSSGFDLSSLSSPLLLALKRHSWRTSVVVNRQVVTTAYGLPFTGGKVGYWAAGNVKLESPRYQPMEALIMDDDFMRTAEDPTLWTTLAGKWSTESVEEINGEVSMSANPFSYEAGEGRVSLAVTGHWFWDNYSFATSVRPGGQGAVGLCFYLDDAQNFLLFRWRSYEVAGDTAKELLLLKGGKPQRLAGAAGGFVPGAWYRLAVRVFDNAVEASIDGVVVLRARTFALGQGKVGLYAEKCKAHFDDVSIRSCEDWDADFSDSKSASWTSRPGSWLVRSGELAASAPSDRAIAFFGPANWQNYRVEVEVQLSRQGGVGVLLNSDGKDSGYLYRAALKGSAVPYEGRQQLVRLAKGREMVLAEGAAAFYANQRTPLVAVSDHGVLRIQAQGNAPLEAADLQRLQGSVGLVVERGRASFSNLRLRFLEDPPQPQVAQRFAEDDLMRGWASPGGEWTLRNDEGTTVFSHRGEFFGNASLHFPASVVSEHGLRAIIAGDESNLDAGHALRVSSLKPGQYVYSFEEEGRVAAKGKFGAEAEKSLTFSQRGGALFLMVDGQPVACVGAPKPAAGHRVGVQVLGGSVSPTQLSATCDHLRDYTFTTAPIGWRPQKGKWEVTTRWACKKDWSFFGGKGDENPTLWTKQPYFGDQVAEFYAALPMDLPHEPGYSHPSDINFTLCADGKDLSSGYSFIYAGWGNRWTRILRKDKVVAETNGVVLPYPPISRNFAFHRRWFYVRIQKQGNRVELSIDDRPVLSYTDPDPLPGGHIACWSFNNGLMIARARIWYEKEGEPLPDPVGPLLSDAASSHAKPSPDRSAEGVFSDFEKGLGEWNAEGLPDPPLLLLDRGDGAPGRGRTSLKIVNTVTGGPFAVYAITTGFNVKQFPKLSFDYRIPSDVHVNLYVRMQGRYYAILLTGVDQPTTTARVLGKIEGIAADNRWHHAELDLLALSRNALGVEAAPDVEQVALASPAGSYLRCGFGGNLFGSSFHLDNFRLGK